MAAREPMIDGPSLGNGAEDVKITVNTTGKGLVSKRRRKVEREDFEEMDGLEKVNQNDFAL